MLNGLEKSILSTIAYFDIFDFPLTAMEVWKWLLVEDKITVSHSFSELQSVLKSPGPAKYLDQKNGFYFLKQRDHILDQRLANYKVAERKFKKAIRFIKTLRHIPFIKMVAVCNSLAFSNAGDYSDIDFFIITQKKRIFLARFWANLLPKLFGARPTRADTQDKLCLTFFVAEDKLNIADLQCSSFDIYLAYWIIQVLPIYNSGHTYENFIEANAWVSSHFPNFIPHRISPRREIKDSWTSRLSRLMGSTGTFGFWGDGQEWLARKIQLKCLPDSLKKMANADTRVVINNQVLKFHDNDRRAKFKEMFEEKMIKVMSNEK